MKNTEQTKNEVISEVTDLVLSDIEGYEGSTFDKLFFDLFNSSYYIIGTYKAKQWLDDKGALNCVEIVTDWEKEVFGEVQFSDFTDCEKLANLCVYCVADTFLNKMLWELDLDQDSEITPNVINEVNNYIKELNK